MKSATGKLVRKSASAVSRPTSADLDRLRAATRGPIDTTDIPERGPFRRLQRDALGRLPSRKSMIRDAVAQQMQARRLTVYRLWRMAQVHYPSLSQAAVHDFLKGRRQIELPSVEALLAAVDLEVVRKNGK